MVERGVQKHPVENETYQTQGVKLTEIIPEKILSHQKDSEPEDEKAKEEEIVQEKIQQREDGREGERRGQTVNRN